MHTSFQRWDQNLSDFSPKIEPIKPKQLLILRYTADPRSLSLRPGCEYNGKAAKWTECDPITGRRVLVKQLEEGSPETCPSTHIKVRRCKKVGRSRGGDRRNKKARKQERKAARKEARKEARRERKMAKKGKKGKRSKTRKQRKMKKDKGEQDYFFGSL